MTISEVNSTLRLQEPYAKCGVIFTTWPDGTVTQGTCAVVGRNDVLTAGHVVYDPDRGGWAASYEFYFGADYNSYQNGFDSYSFSYSLVDGFGWESIAWPNQIYADLDNTSMLFSEAQYDVALIGLSVPIGDVTGWFGLDSGRNFTQTATQLGYPKSGTGMMQSTLSVTKNSYYNIYESNFDAMGPGSSGGPLFTYDGYIIGVKSGGLGVGSTWADIGSVSDFLFPELEKNDYLLGEALIPNITISTHKLSILVDKGVLSITPVILKDLLETIEYKNDVIVNHTITYGSAVFDYSAIDLIITTITRDGSFTEEFSREIADFVPSAAKITYEDAVYLVGASNIDSVLIGVAGADGLYVF